MSDGRLDRATATETVRTHVLPRLRTHGHDGLVYGEKHVHYGPFIDLIHEACPCRFVHLHRDGRDVVRSMMDWHTGKFGNVYREADSSEAMSNEALCAAQQLPAHLDESDHARPRPRPGTRTHAEWGSMPRHEMAAWYWGECNRVLIDRLERLPADSSQRLDLSEGVEAVERIFDFLGLERPSREDLSRSLESRINSLADRGSTSPEPFPRWTDWDSRMRDRFEQFGGETMTALGYWNDPRTRWRPNDFGSTWKDRPDIPGWYEWMFETRRSQHDHLLAFIRTRPELKRIVDVGCGIGAGYHEWLADHDYIGLDLSSTNIEWCRSHRRAARHRYACLDHAVTDPDATQVGDLVFSQGTIDNAWDVDEFLAGMVRWSAGLIYATCYRGWFPELAEHRYRWDDQHGCFYNDISPHRVRRTLEALGCSDIEIRPVTGKGLPCRETLITARVS